MKAHITTAVDTRTAAAFWLLSLLALTAFSGKADARSCRMMKPPPYIGLHMPLMSHPMHKGMPRGIGYAAGTKAGPSVIAVAKRAGDFATLLTAVEAAGLTGLLEGEGPYTLFAPTDAAFKSMPEGALQELLADKAKLTGLRKYQVVSGRVTAAEILVNQTLNAASGQTLPTADLGIVRADIRARNGVVHVMDRVLLPPG